MSKPKLRKVLGPRDTVSRKSSIVNKAGGALVQKESSPGPKRKGKSPFESIDLDSEVEQWQSVSKTKCIKERWRSFEEERSFCMVTKQGLKRKGDSDSEVKFLGVVAPAKKARTEAKVTLIKGFKRNCENLFEKHFSCLHG
jgi:hypothetical protein